MCDIEGIESSVSTGRRLPAATAFALMSQSLPLPPGEPPSSWQKVVQSAKSGWILQSQSAAPTNAQRGHCFCLPPTPCQQEKRMCPIMCRQ